MNQVITIAMPPPRGVGIVCELLSFGTSITFFLPLIHFKAGSKREKLSSNNFAIPRIFF